VTTEPLKPRASLVPVGVMAAVIRVLTKGVAKHGDTGWQQVSREEHYDAMERHKEAYLLGEDVDAESGESHLAHLITRAMFLWWLNDQDEVDLAELGFAAMREHGVDSLKAAGISLSQDDWDILKRAQMDRAPGGDVEWRCESLPEMPMTCPTLGAWKATNGVAVPTVCPGCGSPMIKVRVGGKEI